ncbi:hypothetical protein ACSHUI_00670 [Bacillus subtilis]|uniref:hypothetical protein n=1 Tax=Bacillus subtilis TaxID=1423 RepID=UPI003CF9052A
MWQEKQVQVVTETTDKFNVRYVEEESGCKCLTVLNNKAELNQLLSDFKEKKTISIVVKDYFTGREHKETVKVASLKVARVSSVKSIETRRMMLPSHFKEDKLKIDAKNVDLVEYLVSFAIAMDHRMGRGLQTDIDTLIKTIEEAFTYF